MADYPQLQLDNQLCFPLYAAHRLVTQSYKPLLKELDLTYPQYLILLVLWEEDNRTIMEIGDLLWLSSNTLTPLLKRLENKGIIDRKRSNKDERKVYISLTKEGKKMREKAAKIPEKLIGGMKERFSPERAILLREELKVLIKALS